MATTRIRHRARATQGTGGVASPLFGGESIGEVAKWATCVSPIHSHADLKNGSRTVQSVALETAPHASPLNVRACRCGRLLDVLGHHRAACSRVGELGKRGFAAESAVAQICREGGARVSTNVMLRDLDISPPHSSDERRLEVVAEGLCLFGGCQLALDATVVSTLHGDGTHRRKADVEDGVALKEARRSKEATYQELCRGDGRARLVVIAGEVGGRWSQETKDFLWCLACEKSKSSPWLLQGSARLGWYRRWCCLLACSTAKAVACSLVGHRGSPGSGDQVPSAHEVLTEAR